MVQLETSDYCCSRHALVERKRKQHATRVRSPGRLLPAVFLEQCVCVSWNSTLALREWARLGDRESGERSDVLSSQEDKGHQLAVWSTGTKGAALCGDEPWEIRQVSTCQKPLRTVSGFESSAFATADYCTGLCLSVCPSTHAPITVLRLGLSVHLLAPRHILSHFYVKGHYLCSEIHWYISTLVP